MSKLALVGVLFVFAGCTAFGYADQRRAIGIAIGNGAVSACKPNATDCPAVRGGSIGFGHAAQVRSPRSLEITTDD